MQSVGILSGAKRNAAPLHKHKIHQLYLSVSVVIKRQTCGSGRHGHSWPLWPAPRHLMYPKRGKLWMSSSSTAWIRRTSGVTLGNFTVVYFNVNYVLMSYAL